MMKAISVLQEGTQWAHEFLEMVMVDVTPDQAHWRPLGIANPLGAVYADGVIGMLKGSAPLFASTWAGKTGVSDPQFQMTLEWAQGLKVELPTFRQYAQAVYTATNDYLASLTDESLSRQIDLSNVGLGQKPLSWCLNALLISHLNNMIGEISCLKGLQGAKGYPF
jgi:hypothetical protein